MHKGSEHLLKLKNKNVRLNRKRNSLRLSNSSYTFHLKNTILLGKFVRGGKNPLLEKQRQQIQKNLRSIKGSLAIEGLKLTKEEEELIISNALGEISNTEFDKKVMDLINNE